MGIMDSITNGGHYNNIGAVVLDFDSTIAKIDVCDAIMQFNKTDWEKVGVAHDIGDISHAELNRRFTSMITKTPNEIKAFLNKGIFLRVGAVNLIRELQENNVPVFVVSGGWDLYIEDILSREGGLTNLAFIDRVGEYSAANTNIISNHLFYDGDTWTIEQPPIPSSFKSSPCKKKILQALRSKVTGEIVFIGDGSTDFAAAEVADIVFARAQLADHCKMVGIPYYIYNDLNDVNLQMHAITRKKTHYGKTLDLLRAKFFLNPTGSNLTTVSDTITSTLVAVVSSHGDGPTYPLMSERQTPRQSILSAILEAKTALNPKEFLAKALPTGLQGGVKAGHPTMVKNIIPTPSTVFLSAYLAASIYAQNGVTGEDSAEAVNSELKITAVLSDLAGYSRELSAGIFTFGGTGTNMYGIKMGLAKACPHHATEGIREKVCVVGSKPAHYSHVTVSDWLGIGQNNYLYARSHIDQSTDLEDLEKKCRGVVEEGGKLACIIGVAGTTSNMAIDDFKAIKSIRDKLVDDYGLEYIPHIHADSVVGWPYLYFTGYNFKENPMGFSPAAIQRIKTATARISTLSYADSFGVDFHKTGFMPYIASMVICKNEADIRVLSRDAKIMTPLFHDDSVYSPGKFTLETSRSSATMLASWLTMQALGIEGYQALIGHAQEMAVTLREEISNSGQAGLFVGNQISYGTDVFVRCYPPHNDPTETYIKELKDDTLLAENSKYTSDFFRWLTQDTKKYNDALDISKTSAAFYTESGKPFVALRLYMLNPYTTVESIKKMVRSLVEAKNEYNSLVGKSLATPLHNMHIVAQIV